MDWYLLSEGGFPDALRLCCAACVERRTPCDARILIDGRRAPTPLRGLQCAYCRRDVVIAPAELGTISQVRTPLTGQ